MDCKPQTYDYATDVQPIFETNCVNTCHKKGGTGWTPTGMINGGNSFEAVDNPLSSLVNVRTFINPDVDPKWRVRPFSPDDSYIYTLLLGKPSPEKNVSGTEMPQNLPLLPAAQIEIIKIWIEEGACESDTSCNTLAQEEKMPGVPEDWQ
jgi:hypothetical protein